MNKPKISRWKSKADIGKAAWRVQFRGQNKFFDTLAEPEDHILEEPGGAGLECSRRRF